MKVTRRFYFSASHKYYREDWTESENKRVFGKCVNYHGHNYVLDVTVEGNVDPETGMVINLTELKKIVNQVLEEFDHKNLNEDLPYFKKKIPTTENIAIVLWELIRDRLPNTVMLSEIRLYETDDLFVIYRGEHQGDEHKPILGRKYRFSASHRLNNPNLSEEDNKRIFGKCNNPNGHGHNYYLELGVQNVVNHNGMVIDLKRLDTIVMNVINELDYKWLDRDIEFFRDKVPTTENLLLYLKQKLTNVLPGLSFVRIEETLKNYFELEA